MPKEVKVQAYDADGKLLMTGPVPEHIDSNEPFQDDPRVTPAFNGSSPSGDVTAPVVYANYGRPEDFQQLADLGINVKGKIVLVPLRRQLPRRQGLHRPAARRRRRPHLLRSRRRRLLPRRHAYPNGPYRPASAVQRGSVQFMFKYPGDALTPGIASTPDLPASKLLKPEDVVEPAQNSL